MRLRSWLRFRHDEIRNWYGNIRLDHGYALTITSAQGLTVDRAFLLADARPARETIYPAATRHRDRLDIYVNRAPLALDIGDRRADDDRETAVTDTEIQAWLAERWSRSQPKEAALDYMADGEWQDRREEVRRDGSRSAGETRNGTARAPRVRTAANDNALARIARDIRRTAFGWRHARTVAAFADGRREVLAAWDALRARPRRRRWRGARPGSSGKPLPATPRCSGRPGPSAPGRMLFGAEGRRRSARKPIEVV